MIILINLLFINIYVYFSDKGKKRGGGRARARWYNQRGRCVSGRCGRAGRGGPTGRINRGGPGGGRAARTRGRGVMRGRSGSTVIKNYYIKYLKKNNNNK